LRLIGYVHPRGAQLLDGFCTDLDAIVRRNRLLPPLKRESPYDMVRRLQARGFQGGMGLVRLHLRADRPAPPPAGHYKLGGMTDDELLAARSGAYARHGHLSMAIIRQDPTLAHPSTVVQVFGSMNAAYDKIGFIDGRRKPTIGPYIRQLREMVETNSRLPADERLRFVDMYAGLRSSGYAGSYTSVRKHALKLA